MVWTDPRTWVSGEVVTAAQLNAHLRDNLKAIGDARASYTPTLTAGSSNPTLGAGSSATGKYLRAGKLVIGAARIEFGTGMAAGSGEYRVSLPVTAIAVGETAASATTRMYDDSADALLTPTALIGPTGAYLLFQYPATWPTGATTFVGAAAPWAWAASDWIEIAFMYEAA